MKTLWNMTLSWLLSNVLVMSSLVLVESPDKSNNLGVSPLKILGPKTCKISVNFVPRSRISRERGNISKIGKRYELGQFLLRLMKKVRWTMVHYREFHVSLVPLKCTFLDTISRPSGVLRPEIFTLARDWPRLLSAHTPTWMGSPPPKKKRIDREYLKFDLKFSV